MKKPMNGARRIIVNDKEYYWVYRKSMVLIWTEEGAKYVFSDNEVTGLDNDVIERGRAKRHFSITSREIAEWIHKEEL